MIANREIDLNNLVVISSSGVEVASFVQIQAALINRYKEIYGSDIDLSTGNADGEFVNELALMLNNLVQSIKTLYSNLDVNTASGVYLEALCNLSNVHRKPATRSTATVELQNDSGSTVTINANSFLQDQAGTIWNITSSNVISLADGDSVVIEVQCSQLGPVEAPAGWINILAGEPNVIVTQSIDANLGQNVESDTSLRSRRNRYLGSGSLTVLQGLAAALFDLQGVLDVKIYNNQNDSVLSTSDGTDVVPHGIYVIIRQTSNDLDLDNSIGQTIYDRLTPGIRTTQTEDATGGVSGSHVYIPTILGSSIQGFTETVYWKKAVPISTSVTFKYTEINNTGYSPTTGQIIGEALKEYLNDLHIGEGPTANDVIMTMLMADPKQKGLSTISVNYSDVVSSISGITNLDRFYNYTQITETTHEDNPSIPAGEHRITLS